MDKTAAHVHSLMLDPNSGCMEGAHPALHCYLSVFAAKKVEDPDSPQYHQALMGPHGVEFREAMTQEIVNLEQQGM